MSPTPAKRQPGPIAARVSPGARLIDCCFVVDEGKRLQLWNQEAERLFGFTAAMVLGRRCLETICRPPTGSPDTCPTHDALLRGVQSGRPPKTLLMDLFRADGRPLSVEVMATPVELDAGAHQLAVLHMVQRIASPGGTLPGSAPVPPKGSGEVRRVYVGTYGPVDMEM